MQQFFYYFLFVLGLGIGSFMNVVSLRYNPEQKLFDLKIIGGRSHCPQCKKQLKWYELVPIFSFLVQKGRCRSCLQRISFQYPIVEILTAFVFIAVPLIVTSFWPAVAWIFIFCMFILLSIIDFKHLVIPDEINILLAISGFALIFLPSPNLNFEVTNSFTGHYSLLFGSLSNVWLNHIMGAILGMVFFGLIIGISRGRAMGWGDFKLAGALGLIFGWPDILIVLGFSFVAGAIFGLLLIARKKKGMKDVVPFGPFLVIGSALTFFLGYNIINAYFKLFGL